MLSEEQIIKNLSLGLRITFYLSQEEFIMLNILMQVVFPTNSYLLSILSVGVD